MAARCASPNTAAEYAKHPALIRLRELQTLSEVGKNANARIFIGFDKHAEVHLALRPTGKWSTPGSGPGSNAEWAQVDAYMGLFERAKVLIDNGVLNMGTFVRLYGYRLDNILGNPMIVESKLEHEKELWSDFIALCAAVKEHERNHLPERPAI